MEGDNSRLQGPAPSGPRNVRTAMGTYSFIEPVLVHRTREAAPTPGWRIGCLEQQFTGMRLALATGLAGMAGRSPD